MQILNELEAEPLPIEEEEKRHTRRLLIGVFCAVLLTAVVLGGYLWLRKRHERQLAAAVAVETQRKLQKLRFSSTKPLSRERKPSWAELFTTSQTNPCTVSLLNCNSGVVSAEEWKRASFFLRQAIWRLTPEPGTPSRFHHRITSRLLFCG